jgi:hypothetical protein
VRTNLEKLMTSDQESSLKNLTPSKPVSTINSLLIMTEEMKCKELLDLKTPHDEFQAAH